MLNIEQNQAVDEDTRELISQALDKMPNFSSEIQTNNVLTKRILALKVKDGLHVNVQEAEREMKMNMQRLTVNPAATTDEQVEDIIQSVVNDSQNQSQQPAAASTGDLLDLGGPAAQS